jgi:hypothetical protein
VEIIILKSRQNHKDENDDLSNITTSGPFFNQVA